MTMTDTSAPAVLARCSLLLLCSATSCLAITVATVGDSFADSFYYAMRSRPDLLRQYDVQLTRWSRPIVGLTRTDYFDYASWLRDSTGLASADVCLVQIGANDMQSIPVSKEQWIVYGSPQWRSTYAARTREMALILTERRCGQVIWVLQPGFEERDAMACHRELIDEVQRDVLQPGRTRVLELVTTSADYGPDKTHFNRAYVLQLGPALFHLIDTSRQIAHMGCLLCHRNLEGFTRQPNILPLRSWQRELAEQVWMPDRTGVQCRMKVRTIRTRSRSPARGKRRVRAR